MAKYKDKDHSYSEEKEGVSYTCPMHPKIKCKRSEMCPECGMGLVKAEDEAVHETEGGKGHDKHEGHSTEMFIKRFRVVAVLAIPLIVYSELPEIFFDWEAPRFFGWEYLMLLLGTIVFFYGGRVFISGAYREIREKLPGMMTLISIAIVSAYTWSVYATFTPDETLFWELSTLIAVMLLGHWIEMRAVTGARGALKELASILPKEATVIRGGKEMAVSLNDIKEGEVSVVKPGEKMPVDGLVKDGSSEVDESIVTGESKPVTKKKGDEVIAGTINGDGGLKIKVTKIGDDTFLANVMRLVSEAESSKSRLQVLSDKAALILTIVAVGAGSVTFFTWLLVGDDIAFAVARLVAVLVITCPHALGLAVPLVASVSTNMAAAQGFIIKQRLALESARKVDWVLFDKTGTLTKGEFGVDSVLAISGLSEQDVISVAASVNSGSEHPIAKAIVDHAKKKGVDVLNVDGFERIPGKGAKGYVNGKNAVVGSEVLVNEHKASVPEHLLESVKKFESKGKTVVYVLRDEQFLGVISLSDIIREESKEAVKVLYDQGIRVMMVTGDSEDAAGWVAGELGIDEYFARVLPEQKVEKVKELQGRGLKVAVVGDGVNDAPALTQADVGVAIGAGTNVAVESAGIILAKNDPLDIPRIIRLSRLTYRKMIQNLFWATGYNVVALPLAAGALVAFGIPAIDPAIGAIFMSASTVIVAFNAVLLKRFSL